MSESSTPFSEAIERLGEAAKQNVEDAVANWTAWATALGAAAATPPSATPRDDLARSAVAAWVGGLKAVAVNAVAISDAAAILSDPPSQEEYYDVDLAVDVPGRTNAATLSITSVAWTSKNATGDPPSVSIIGKQPIAAPPAGGPDVVRFRVVPSADAKALTVKVRVDGIGAPKKISVRLSPVNLVLDP